MTKSDSDELRKLGVLYEALQDDLQKLVEILSAQIPTIQKIPKMAERIEKVESDVLIVKLATTGTNNDLRLIKIRTEKLEALVDQQQDHEIRLTQLEHA